MALVPRGPVRRMAPRQQPRRRLVWSRSTQSSVAVTNAQYDLLTDFRTAAQYGAQPLGTTITRVRGAIVLIPSAPTPTGIVLGMVVEDRAAPQVRCLCPSRSATSTGWPGSRSRPSAVTESPAPRPASSSIFALSENSMKSVRPSGFLGKRL